MWEEISNNDILYFLLPKIVMHCEFLFVLVPFYSLLAHKKSHGIALSNKFAIAFVVLFFHFMTIAIFIVFSFF